MNFYVLLTVFMIILLFSHRKYYLIISDRKYFLHTGFAISFVLFFLAAFRGEGVGHDTANYTSITYIEQRANSSLSSLSGFTDIDTSIEFISNFINSIVYHWGINGQWVVILYAIITIAFIYMSSRRMKINPAYVMGFFVVLGFYFYSLSACRQMCATGVILYAMTFLKETNKKSRLFFLWIVVAIMIHSMSFICLPLYLVRLAPDTLSYRKIGWGILLVSLFLTLVKIDFLNQLSIFADSKHLSNYIEAYGESSTTLFSLAGCWVETGCLFWFFLLKKRGDIDKRMTVYDYLFLFSMLISAALLQYDGLVARVKYNIIIMQCLYLAQLFTRRGIWRIPSNAVVVTVYMMLRIAKNFFFEVALESDYYFCFL